MQLTGLRPLAIMRLLPLIALLALRFPSAAARADNSLFTAQHFGAKPNGISDCTQAIQAALDAGTRGGGGTVALGVGRYVVAGSLRVPPGVTLQGTWQTPHHAQGLSGTVLLITGGRGRAAGPAAIEAAGNCAVRAG